MAKHSKKYGKKTSPAVTFLYFLAILALIAALVFMYKLHRDKRNNYGTLMRQATETDAGYDIQSRKNGISGTPDSETVDAQEEDENG